ncbi:hypothetical protein FB45DRAFT_1011001 [Roridomyces roridus]|uniref:F-box domain-containing protein n=1 Tax=Roridomyces roridus TaxID=1738132 RepID=A0AAD7FA96_9AGAR|nr:hypothetical protein FB45DRAFT_1011001 [Roridomyces roridus]
MSTLNGFGSLPSPALQHLTLPPQFERAALPALLERCPALKSLNIIGLSEDADIVTIPPHLAPRLSKLTAPAGIVVDLACRRPVCEVGVVHQQQFPLAHEAMRRVLLQLSRASSSAVRCLALPESQSITESLRTVVAIFPGLSKLTLDVPGSLDGVLEDALPRAAISDSEEGGLPVFLILIGIPFDD